LNDSSRRVYCVTRSRFKSSYPVNSNPISPTPSDLVLLNKILKDEWSFKGLVVSEWNATHSTRGIRLEGNYTLAQTTVEM
jgi:beta-glucosidase-like glycosyl hydrolase